MIQVIHLNPLFLIFGIENIDLIIYIIIGAILLGIILAGVSWYQSKSEEKEEKDEPQKGGYKDLKHKHLYKDKETDITKPFKGD